MSRHTPEVISIHHYVLKPDADEKQFEQAFHDAQKNDLLSLPGLIDSFLVKGIRGSRRGHYTTIWIYESREAWENLWGSIEKPRSKQDYPKNWRIWEDEILAPFLTEDPDTIDLTAYEVMRET